MRIKNKDGHQKVLLNYKVWLSSITGNGVVGETEYSLLKHIVRSQSLKAASDDLGISYRKAWGDLKKAEKLLGYELLDRKEEGEVVGLQKVTDRAIKLIEAYEALQQTFDEKVEAAFDEFKNKIK